MQALAAAYGLDVPAPDILFAISERHTLRTEGRWSILTPRYQLPDTLVSHLGFALRHEAVDLGLLAALFRRPEVGAAYNGVGASPADGTAPPPCMVPV